MLRKLSSLTRNLSIAAVGSVMASSAFAAGIDTTAVQTAISEAESSATTVGGYVITAVATLVVVGLIIAIVKKL